MSELLIEAEEIAELLIPDYSDDEENVFEVLGTIAATSNLTATATVTTE
jgi:DNA integrity scanning protein DisA with diadenylate cyclase activity